MKSCTSFSFATKDGNNKTLIKSPEEPRYIPKPLDAEEAALILGDEKLSFVVFRNIRNERICVIYPIGNHEYGLIET